MATMASTSSDTCARRASSTMNTFESVRSSAVDKLCSRLAPRLFVLIKAVLAPNLATPSQIATKSAEFVIINAAVSFSFNLMDSQKPAT